MMKIKNQDAEDGSSALEKGLARRNFMKYAGISLASAGLIMAGCKKDQDSPAPVVDPTAVDLGSGDIGILNYAYALEQLEAAFYTSAVASSVFASVYSAEEKQVLMDLKIHEVAHREFLKTALGTMAIPSLEVDFSTINFSDRMSVLSAAKAFEDLGVSAYNGAGKLIVDKNYLLLAGKIVSVEARHASAIRDLLSPKTNSFAGDDVVEPTKGLDAAQLPPAVLAIAGKYIKTKINASNLPTS
jgi:hypothetical protein